MPKDYALSRLQAGSDKSDQGCVRPNSVENLPPTSRAGAADCIDRFMSEIRTLRNVCGNAVAMIVIAKWERAFGDAKAGDDTHSASRRGRYSGRRA